MMQNIIDDVAQLSTHGRQIWLLGAGASFKSNLPLVSGLTSHVRTVLAETPFTDEAHPETMIGHIIEGICSSIGPDSTIEDILDHLADLLSMARRSVDQKVAMNVIPPSGEIQTKFFTYLELQTIHLEILRKIRDIIRWGYIHSSNPDECTKGTPENPILCVKHHLSFIDILFDVLRAGREPRVQPIEFFTTNYDTLIEDALALKAVPYIDGFTGGALAYWDPSTLNISNPNYNTARARVIKIHGSIDWTRFNNRIIRRRISDAYPKETSDLLIYPQALKYELTKREPFDTLLSQLRNALNRNTPQVLFVCGYGFGDEHINQEIHLALSKEDSQLTLVSFSQYRDGLPLQWQSGPFGERVYLITKNGIWRGTEGPFNSPPDGEFHDWWTFTGMTSFLRNPEEYL